MFFLEKRFILKKTLLKNIIFLSLLERTNKNNKNINSNY